MLGILGIAMAAGALTSTAFSVQWPFMAVLIVCALFGAAAIGWNGVYLAEVARVATSEFAGMATGGALFFTFAGILIGLPVFSLIVEKSGSYPLGFGIIAVAAFVCGIVLLLPHTSR
jgi:MFS family permease